MAGLKYNNVTCFKVRAKCEGPLHVGSAVGDKGEVLVNPVDGRPFIQASSIAGALRYYSETILGVKRTCGIFGSRKFSASSNAIDGTSRIRVEDGEFIGEVLFELRPHLKINNATGTVSGIKTKGNGTLSGQKFDMEYIGAGACFEFDMTLFTDADSHEEMLSDMNKILAAMKSKAIMLGGKRSNGCGRMGIEKIYVKHFNLIQEEDRKKWGLFDFDIKSEYEDKTDDIADNCCSGTAYKVIVFGKTENSILVKGIAVDGHGKDAPDSENIKNVAGERIIPGSSVKGALRAQMEKIAGYIDRKEVILDSFGYKEKNSGKRGNLIFGDVIIGKAELNDNMPIEHRIHIDKFTGGVFDGAMINEKNAAGELTSFEINIENANSPEKTLALLLFALRDLSCGMLNLGSGYSVGKGIIDVESIAVMDLLNNNTATIHYANGNSSIEDQSSIISKSINALKGGEN